MMVLFVNPTEPQCGVYQYGQNLFTTLKPSDRHSFSICFPRNEIELRDRCQELDPDVLMYNWSPGIGGWMGQAPFKYARRHIAVYHAGDMPFEKFDAILFSDPTAKRERNLFPIGRPLPNLMPEDDAPKSNGVTTIGVNGFCGALAVNVVQKVIEEFEYAIIRLHLPSATYGDSLGHQAQRSAEECLALVRCRIGIKLEICFEFVPTMEGLVERLHQNDLNCYIRHLTPEWGLGVSSVIDCALAARRPIAINRSVAFRHLLQCSPSICVEDNSLKTIMKNGIEPLLPLYSAFAPERIREQVEKCLSEICV